MNLPSRIRLINNPLTVLRDLAQCQDCPRLTDFRHQVAQDHPHYHNAPVAPWGDPDAAVLIVGLAPGKHGANASGYPFTGDASGVLLFKVLHRVGFCSHDHPDPLAPDFRLNGCRITNAVKCLPPGNKPSTREIQNCARYLDAELGLLKAGGVVIALGRIAHSAVVSALRLRQKDYIFGHASEHLLEGEIYLLNSYHCSRYNVQTRRINEDMLYRVFQRAAHLRRDQSRPHG